MTQPFHVISDLTLVIDQSGIIRGLSCNGASLSRELGDSAWYQGRPWIETVTDETRAAVSALLQTFEPHPPIQRHVNQVSPEGIIIPMLYSIARVSGQVVASGRDLRQLDLTMVVLGHEDSATRAYSTAMCSTGIRLETFWLDVLAPAARRLGDLWLADACSFSDVTAGVGGLQNMLHDSFHAGRTEIDDTVHSKRILLATLPGEQHRFGLAMVAALFRNAGWFVRHEAAPSGAYLIQLLKRNWFTAVGISATDESQLDGLAALIHAFRRGSRNPAIHIMVGGSLFTEKPELAEQVGADATAFDGRQAVRRAQRFIDENRAERPRGNAL